MVPARRLANLFAVVLAAAGILTFRSVAAAATGAVPDTPVHPGAWTTNRQRSQEGAWTTNRQRSQGKASIENSHQQLEEQAFRETRETFGEDFCQQLEEEHQAVRRAKEGRAGISREAGCSPASPLSSPSLGGSIEVPGDGDGTTRQGTAENDLLGPITGDWLR